MTPRRKKRRTLKHKRRSAKRREKAAIRDAARRLGAPVLRKRWTPASEPSLVAWYEADAQGNLQNVPR